MKNNELRKNHPLAWHITTGSCLEHEGPPHRTIEVGVRLRARKNFSPELLRDPAEVELCSQGMHASPTLREALECQRLFRGGAVNLVLVQGGLKHDRDPQFGRKLAGMDRTVLSSWGSRDILRIAKEEHQKLRKKGTSFVAPPKFSDSISLNRADPRLLRAIERRLVQALGLELHRDS